MARLGKIGFATAVWTLATSAILGAQIFVPAQARDSARTPAPPTERRIPVGTSSICGTVTTETGTPVPGVRVTVNGQPAASSPGTDGEQMWLTRTVTTDASGEFSFPRLPAGAFTITAAHAQNLLLPTNYGQRRPGGQGQIIQLADGQKISLNVPMQRGSTISGVIIGPNGDPQAGAQVHAMRYVRWSGFRRLEPVKYAQTDDRGVYRLFGLAPGDYVIAAIPNSSDLYNNNTMGIESDVIERAIVSGPVRPPARPGALPTVSVPIPTLSQFERGSSLAYLPTYAPNASSPSDATAISVTGSDERSGIDIQVRLLRATTIRGTIATPLDPGVTAQLWLQSDDASVQLQGGQSGLDEKGNFVFSVVPPGSYTVFAQTVVAPQSITWIDGEAQPSRKNPPLSDAQKMWGKARVTVAGEPNVTMSLNLQPSRSISGTVVFEMQERPDLTTRKVTVTVAAAPSPQQIWIEHKAAVGPDGRFTIAGVPAGRYTFRIDAGGYLKSATIAGQDTLDGGLDFTGDRDVTDAVLTLTDQMGEVTGTLTNSAGKPAMDYTIIIAPTDSRFWTPQSRRIRSARPAINGDYEFEGLPAGSYGISVVTDLEEGALNDPEFLRAISQTALPVLLADKGRITQALRVK